MKTKGHQALIVLCLVNVIIAATGRAEVPQRKYAPDRDVDILHVKIDVTPDFANKTVAGQTEILFVPMVRPLTELRLDAEELTVMDIQSNATIARTSATDEAITIIFDPAISPGVKASVTIQHEAEPEAGLYFRTPDMGYAEENIHLFTQGESHEARHWFPNYDYPNERFTSEVICRVPPSMTVLSNGRLISETTDSPTGLKAVHWHQEKPHVNYLIALAAGNFKSIEATYKDIPLAFYTPNSYIDLAANSFDGTVDMMGFFEQEIGVPYPWHKYYQVAVDDFVAGGMENTSLTILTHRTLFESNTEQIDSSTSLVAHELAHMWFGDYLTCKDWTNLWLNEGFATYYENLYLGHKHGRSEFLYSTYRDVRQIVRPRKNEKPIYHRTYEDSMEQFDYRAYAKGGWVLHMLRSQLGDDLFRKCVQTYVERFALGIVETADLQAVFEELSGRSLDRFFDQWVYYAGFPELKITYQWLAKEGLAKLSVKQTQTVDDQHLLFDVPGKIRFLVGAKAVDRMIKIDEVEQDFYFGLAAEPTIVRFDPDYTVLADIEFKKPKAMLYEQLLADNDVIGQLLAVKALEEKDDKKTVANLKQTLNHADFYGIRIQVVDALGEIHTDEAFQALADSLHQADARVRLRVVNGIGKFYRSEALNILSEVVTQEQNPMIVAAALRHLGRYHSDVSREQLLNALNSPSFRNRIADAAVDALRKLGDPSLVAPLQKAITEHEGRFLTGDLGDALDTLALLASDLDDKSDVRQFITPYVNHSSKGIQVAAIGALGSLQDPRAIPVVETFAGDNARTAARRNRLVRTANASLEKLRKVKKIVPEEIVELRKTVDELKEDNQELKDKLDDIEKRLKATEQTDEEGEESESDPPLPD
ncbi:M1 family aminopeptidase [Planctomycetota bacterium]